VLALLQALTAAQTVVHPSHAIAGRYTHLLTWSKIAELYRLTLPDEEPKGRHAELQRGADYRHAITDRLGMDRGASHGAHEIHFV